MKKLWLLAVLTVCISMGATFWYAKKSMPSQISKDQQLSGWTIVIPGITGDLAKRKLIPALYRLYKQGMQATIIGTGRRDANIIPILEESKKFVEALDAETWKQFTHMVVYHKLDPCQFADFKALAGSITEYETIKQGSGKRLVFLSLPADVFCPFTRLLVESGIIESGKHQYVLYEKPFGWDVKSAQEINNCITSLLTDKQIYRVDHYVGKGLTQMLPYLPASNALFEHVWDAKSISLVSVVFHETLGIEGRGAFYDRYGAIKDVIQNHVLQLLAFFALDLSRAKTPQAIAQQKAAFLNSLSVREVRRGQHEGYRTEKDVAPDSKTETYAAITLESSDARWKGVKFFLETGKALAEKNTQLSVIFKPEHKANKLIVQFAPKELVLLHLNGLEASPMDLSKQDFNYPEAYEAILKDVLTEQLRYSVSFEEIQAQWRLVDSMLAMSSELFVYPKGKVIS
jgi:glucose-6-phosphate 1-dehydrogenase